MFPTVADDLTLWCSQHALMVLQAAMTWPGTAACVSEALIPMQELRARCREAGIHEVICKPFRVQDVQRVLASIPPRSP